MTDLQYEEFPLERVVRERPRHPQSFGQWHGLATVGEVVREWMDGETGPHYYGERVRMWLADRGVTNLNPGVERTLGWCESGAEVVTAMRFAPRIENLRRYDERVLAWGVETLELQVPIEGTSYRADFRWTSRHGVALVEVYGWGAHIEQHAKDRARHRHLTGLGHTVLYVPAELALKLPGELWPNLRRRMLEKYERRRDQAKALVTDDTLDFVTADPSVGTGPV